MSKQLSKPTCESAISGETVTNIRKYLQKTRLLWVNRHDNNKFDLNADVGFDHEYKMQQFCFDFVLGNHHKRVNRRKKKKIAKQNM